MAKPKDNKYGIDRWTSNGHGIEIISTKKTGKKPTKKTTKKR